MDALILFLINIPLLQQFTIQLTFRQSYNDPRLSFDSQDSHVSLNGEDMKKIWIPDTFIRNSRAESLMSLFKPEQYARVKPNGDVLLSSRFGDCRIKVAMSFVFGINAWNGFICSLLIFDILIQVDCYCGLSWPEWQGENWGGVPGSICKLWV